MVLMPFGDNQRYDFVIDAADGFHRVQCKTGRLRRGVIGFQTVSKSGGGKAKGYRGQIELFAVYCPETDKVYLVPVSDVPVGQATLRVDEPANNSCVSTVRWAHDYELK